MPPNQVLVGLSLVFNIFYYGTTFQEVMKKHYSLYLMKKLALEEAYEKASCPFKEFMSKHTRQKDLELFLRL